VLEVPIDLIATKNFSDFTVTPIHPPPASMHHQDPFRARVTEASPGCSKLGVEAGLQKETTIRVLTRNLQLYKRKSTWTLTMRISLHAISSILVL
jgi:hypothetical protein